MPIASCLSSLLGLNSYRFLHGPGPGPGPAPCAAAAGPSVRGAGGPSAEGLQRGPSTWGGAGPWPRLAHGGIDSYSAQEGTIGNRQWAIGNGNRQWAIGQYTQIYANIRQYSQLIFAKNAKSQKGHEIDNSQMGLKCHDRSESNANKQIR